MSKLKNIDRQKSLAQQNIETRNSPDLGLSDAAVTVFVGVSDPLQCCRVGLQ